jgi:protoporphyrinogen/coproporphyrinogen III oxidase
MIRVAVIGGGIAGLAAAQAIKSRDRSVDVVVLERGPRTGGHIRSDVVDGYLCESGPDGFLDNAPDTLRLVRELGLQGRLQPSNDAARRRLVFRRGRLYEVPTSLAGFAATPLLSVAAKARILAEPFADARPAGDESIFDFAARRIGQEPASVLVGSMVSGIFAGDARALSLKACFPKMWEMETAHGGLMRALVATRSRRSAGDAPGMPTGRLTSFVAGMTELPDTLARSLAPAVRCGVDVHAVAHAGSHDGYHLATSQGTTHADAVVLAGPAAESAELVKPLDGRLAEALAGISSAPIAVVCLGFDLATVDADRCRFDAFGFLVPHGEGIRILGALFESTIYPGRAPLGKILVRVMVGGALDHDAVSLDDETLLRLVRDDLRRTMSLRGAPEFTRIVRHRRGIPQYTIGHLSRMSRIDGLLAAHPGLFVAGNSYRGVSLNSCISDASHLADRAIAYLQTRAVV